MKFLVLCQNSVGRVAQFVRWHISVKPPLLEIIEWICQLSRFALLLMNAGFLPKFSTPGLALLPTERVPGQPVPVERGRRCR